MIDSLSDIIDEKANEGTDTVMASLTYRLGDNLENLTLTGSSAINGTGNSLNNLLTGNISANILNGGAGADQLSGGQGDDTYILDNPGDTVIEAINEGNDSIQSALTMTLPNNVENLILTGATANNGTGNSVSNLLVGNSAVNWLNGLGGSDSMQGGAGDDVYWVDQGGRHCRGNHQWRTRYGPGFHFLYA